MEDLRSRIMRYLEERRDGVLLTIYVKPGSNRDELVLEGDELVYYTSEPPVKGRANASLIRFLSRTLDLPISKIDIVYGARERLKKIMVRDTSIEIITDKLLEYISTRQK